jgi:hypothetical protein
VAKAQGSSVIVGFCFFGLLGSLFAWAVLWVLGFFFLVLVSLFFFFLSFVWCPCVYFYKMHLLIYQKKKKNIQHPKRQDKGIYLPIMSSSSKTHIPHNGTARKFHLSRNRSILCSSNTE